MGISVVNPSLSDSKGLNHGCYTTLVQHDGISLSTGASAQGHQWEQKSSWCSDVDCFCPKEAEHFSSLHCPLRHGSVGLCQPNRETVSEAHRGVTWAAGGPISLTHFS